MKKFDLKKILLLILALVMVFALVACDPTTPDDGDDDDDETPTALTPSDYFTALWNSSKSIGSQSIGDSDMSFDIGLEVDLTIGTKTQAQITYKLGLDAKVIYDRAGANAGKYSAAMIKLFDRTKTTKSNLLSLYYFMDDPTAVYANIYDQNVKLQFNADNQDAGQANQKIVENLTSFLTDKEVGADSIDDIILKFTNTFGAEFDLDDVLGVLLELMGMDKDELITTIEGIVGDMGVEGANTTLLDLLKGFGGIALTNVSKTAIEGGYTWSANLKPAMVQLLNGFTNDLFKGQSTIGLSFDTNTAGDDIENFTIFANRPGVLGDKGFTAKIKISQLEVKAVTAAASGTGSVFGITKADFKEDFQIGLNATISVADAMLKLSYNDETEAADGDRFSQIYPLYTDATITLAPIENLAIQGIFNIEADGQINLMKNDSDTAAYAKITYKANAQASPVTVVEASFKNTDGVGTAKIWVNESNDYAKVARDYLVMNLVRSLHNSNEIDPLDPENPTRQEYLDGTNGAAIAALLGALNDTRQSQFIITGLELQQMLWDFFFIEDEKKEVDPSVMKVFTGVDYLKVATDIDGYTYNASTQKYSKGEGEDLVEKTAAELYKLAKVPSSVYPYKANILSIVQMAIGMVSQSESDAFALTAASIAGKVFAPTMTEINQRDVIAQLGFFSTLYQNTSGGVIYDSFSTQQEFYSWIYKGGQGAINRMTDANIIPAIKLVANASKGKYVYNDKFVLVEWKSGMTGTRYDIVKATALSENALIGNGTWFYQNSSTISKDEALMMWRIATGETTGITNFVGSAVEASVLNALYDQCIEDTILKLLNGSSFLGTDDAEGNYDAWLDNILAGDLSASISYVTDAGLTIEISYTDISDKTLAISLNLSIEELSAPYQIPTSANLNFTEATEGVCVIDVSSYMPGQPT